MGVKLTDLRPINPIYPTAISPASKQPEECFFQVARTDTVSRVVQVLPADATLISITAFNTVNSNAGTSAVVNFTVTKDGATISTGTFNAATAATTGSVIMSNLPNLETLPLGTDITITANYVETGTAGTTGGPYNFRILFVR